MAWTRQGGGQDAERAGARAAAGHRRRGDLRLAPHRGAPALGGGAMRRAAFALGAVAALGWAAPAQAGDPTMPLSQVQPGMHCEARSVLHGTQISTFNA